jgi:Domain of unknown function (DUF4388)
MQIVGHFALISPAGLLQILCQEQRAVLITAQRDAEHAEIRIADGLVLSASCAGRSSEAAICCLLDWLTGQFTVTPLAELPDDDPLGPWEALVLEAARRRDERMAFGDA